MKQYEVVTQDRQFGSKPSTQYIQGDEARLEHYKESCDMADTRILSITEIHEGHPWWIKPINQPTNNPKEPMEQDQKDYFSQLIFEAHANAVNKGWWEVERGINEIITLIHSEISEGAECLRNGEDPKQIYFRPSDSKPEGFPTEIADVVIRVADYLGHEKSNCVSAKIPPELKNDILDGTLFASLSALHLSVSVAHPMISDSHENSLEFLKITMLCCELIAQKAGFNLRAAIRMKLDFNLKRPHRHGGKEF